MKIMRYLLFPVVPIYYAVTWLRNKLYDLGIKKSVSYPFPVICVGNLSVGGTGKTPMVEYLINLLKEEYSLATLSRGYKRKTKDFQLGNEVATAESLGDEPYQFYNKFKNDVIVAVDADRQNGIAKLMALKNKPDVIVLDDAFQHRKVKAGFNILLTTFAHPYFKDIVLPTGNLREPKTGANRADVIVVTKCPENLDEDIKSEYLSRINPKPNQHVFFSSISYSNHVFNEYKSIVLSSLTDFVLVTGIANATPLVNFLSNKNLNFEHLNFKDHYDFTAKDEKMLSKENLIITTEKDFMRLKKFESIKSKLFYLPIRASIDNREKLNQIIGTFVKH